MACRAAGPRAVEFEAMFAEVTTRLEAVACFLALLELLKRGLAVVDQPSLRSHPGADQ